MTYNNYIHRNFPELMSVVELFSHISDKNVSEAVELIFLASQEKKMNLN